MFTIGSASLAPWEVESLRRTLAPALTFTRRYHRQAYCLSTLPTEIGARVEPFREDALTLPAYFLGYKEERIVKLNAAIIDTPLAPLAVVHECSHQILGHHHTACTPKLGSRRERDVWLASALVSVSADFARLVLLGQATVTDVATRCRVPEALVMVRLGLAVLLDGWQPRTLGQALETIRSGLDDLERWIEAVKRQFVLAMSA